MLRNKKDTAASAADISKIAHLSTLKDGETDNAEASGTACTEEADINAETANAEGVSGETAYSSVNDYMPEGMKIGTKESETIKRIEHSDPSFAITARPDRQTMYDFMLYHSYANVLGVLSVLIGIGAIVMVVLSLTSEEPQLMQAVLFGMVAVMFIANSPLTLWFRAKKQSDIICDEKNTITYTFSDAGFDMSRGEDEYADFEWSRMYRIKEGRTGFYMYLEKNRAFVIPKADVEQPEQFRDLLRRNVTKLKLCGGNDDC